jgi:group I intron endonuclease
MDRLKGYHMSFIYIVTNLLDGKIYIGKSKYNNPTYYGSGLKIGYAIKKHGIENFKKEILEECADDMVSEREIYYIEQYKSTIDHIGYNISKGGEGGAHYWSSLTENERKQQGRKISAALTGKKYGPRSETTRKNQALSYNRTPEILEKRAAGKRKFYTCVNHNSLEIYITKNLPVWCTEMSLNLGAMQHNARTRKKLCNKNWSCRFGVLAGDVTDIVTMLNEEIRQARAITKEKIINKGKNGNCKNSYK